jgi:hypothetical protein
MIPEAPKSTQTAPRNVRQWTHYQRRRILRHDELTLNRTSNRIGNTVQRTYKKVQDQKRYGTHEDNEINRRNESTGRMVTLHSSLA